MIPVNFNVIENKYNFKISDLIEVGGRLNNPKRNFLFISKVLGKHLTVKPNICKSVGYLLANTVYPSNDFKTDILKNYILGKESEKVVDKELEKYIEPNERVLVIGFAETATALGMAVACAISSSFYVTTTRECLKSVDSFFNFEEEHSHATSHKCYLRDLYRLETADRIILVDDEITTGNTMLNLIKEFNKMYPNKKYTVLSILDFRNKEHYQKYEDFKKEHNLDIEVKSILSANIETTSTEILTGDTENEAICAMGTFNIHSYFKEKHITIDGNIKEYSSLSGIFGISWSDIRFIEHYACTMADIINDTFKNKTHEKICVLGHGEDIYLPSRIAKYLNGKVEFKTTTRSPIYALTKEKYPIKERTKFLFDGVPYYLYNKNLLEKKYDKVFYISSLDIKHQLTENCINIKL